MGKHDKSSSRANAESKGKARIRKYEKGKQEKICPKDNEKIITFWEKIGKDGTWEEKEYILKIKE